MHRCFLFFVSGIVFATSVRVCGDELDSRIATIAKEERAKWDGLQETSPKVAPLLKQYWASVGELRKESDFSKEGEPWSAAFVSWVVKEAGAKDSFKYSKAHCFYVAAAKSNYLNKIDNPFYAHRPSDVPLEVGDIICQSRGKPRATYDNLNDSTFYPTHCDIVVEVDAAEAIVIGGNVNDSVTRARISLDDRGSVRDSKYIAVVKVGKQASRK